MNGTIIYSVRGPRNLPEMTWEEVAEELKHTDLVVFPVGATEEHGPHLPLATDTIHGTEVSRRIVSRLAANGIRAVAGPPIPFGVSLPYMDFPGTITLTPTTLKAVINDVCNSLIKHGFRKLVLLMSHDENLGAMYSAVQELSQQPQVRVLLINLIAPLLKHYPQILNSKKPSGHAGEGEAAKILASIPELVHLDRAKAYYPERREKFEGDEPIHFGGSVFDPPHGMKEETPIGSFGDPALATAEAGEKSYEFIVDWACQVIKRHFGLK